MNDIPQRVGIYGGTFDPVHIAHLVLAQTALESLSLDCVWFVPSSGNGHYKTETKITNAEHRLNMLRLATENNPSFSISEYEIQKDQFTYTIDTLRHFREEFPDGTEIFLLIGGDWKDKLLSWKEGETLIQEFNVAVFSRRGCEHSTELTPQENNKIMYVDMPLIDISSSKIRDRLQKGLPIENMVPPKVLAYIKEHGLYM